MIWFSTAMLILGIAILVVGDWWLRRGHRILLAEIEKARANLIAEFGDAEAIESRVRDMGRVFARILREKAAKADDVTAARLRATADAVERVADEGRGKA
jgi:hypothetical protein